MVNQLNFTQGEQEQLQAIVDGIRSRTVNPEGARGGLPEILIWSKNKFRARLRAICWEISTTSVKGGESGLCGECIRGIGRRVEARKSRLFPEAIARNRCSTRDHAESRA